MPSGRHATSIPVLGTEFNSSKGNANLMATHGNKTFIVFSGKNPNGSTGTPQYITFFDRSTSSMGTSVYLGSAGDGEPNVNNWPGICVDSKGFLHVILAAYGSSVGQCFKYTKSTAVDSIPTGGLRCKVLRQVLPIFRWCAITTIPFTLCAGQERYSPAACVSV